MTTVTEYWSVVIFVRISSLDYCRCTISIFTSCS